MGQKLFPEEIQFNNFPSEAGTNTFKKTNGYINEEEAVSKLIETASSVFSKKKSD